MDFLLADAIMKISIINNLGFSLICELNSTINDNQIMNLRSLLTITTLLILISCGGDEKMRNAPYQYRTATEKWAESWGNHRAVLEIKEPSDVVNLSFDWRRSDKDVANRRFLIIDSQTGDTIPQIIRKQVDNQRCHILFGPAKSSGTYYFYYLPYQVQEGYGFYGQRYLSPENGANEEFIKLSVQTEATDAEVVAVESRTDFDTFYPMSIIANEQERDSLSKSYKGSFHLFAEDRTHPIRMKRDIPYRWISSLFEDSFYGESHPNEYYAFQIGVWADKAALQGVSYRASDLKCGEYLIPASHITCFNMEGVTPYGESFTKKLEIPEGEIQPLWFGVDIAKEQPKGSYKGSIDITTANGETQSMPITIQVSGEMLTDRGDSEPWRHSRIRWLNSTLGIADTPTTGYEDMLFTDQTIKISGRSIKLSDDHPLPSHIEADGEELLGKPLAFIIETERGIEQYKATFKVEQKSEGHISGSFSSETPRLKIEGSLRAEFDGWIDYNYRLTATNGDVKIKDIRLEVPYAAKSSQYFMGMGLPGCATPRLYQSGWGEPLVNRDSYGVSLPVSEKVNFLWPFDSFWAGSDKVGMQVEMRGANYTGPLLTLYRDDYPASWYNSGKGGFKMERKGDNNLATIYSGARELKEDSSIEFKFALTVTPVKQLDSKAQFENRYYHNGGKPEPSEEDYEAGVNIINVHHANKYNPFINYPFKSVDRIKEFTNRWHEKGARVKIYYTVRELTNSTTELWALRSLGEEVLRGGNGGGYPWLQEHLVDGYTPQWYQHLDNETFDVTADASILTSTGATRWYNYYIEGLAWMIREMDIDGIYLDDVAFDREILKRIRRAMDGVKPGCLIDLHSNTGFSKGPAMHYLEFFPYVDKLWFGESFMYDDMSPENWLVEVSGIPFGLMGDMLHRGGNRWLGMQYGMTVRHPWVTDGVMCDPRPIWKVWDKFDIKNSTMVGFWDDRKIITSSNRDIKATVYIKSDKLLISVGNYSEKGVKSSLNIDFSQLPISKDEVSEIYAPSIEQFQEEEKFSLDGNKLSLEIEAKKGKLIIVDIKH